MDMTTEENNLKGRVEYLEGLLGRIYDTLQDGSPIYQNSQAHREIGICLNKIHPDSTDWGTDKVNPIFSVVRKLISCFPEKIPKGEDEVEFAIPAYIIEDIKGLFDNQDRNRGESGKV